MRSAAWFRRHDPNDRIVLVPWQQAPDPFATPEIRAAAARKVQLIEENGRRTEGGQAILKALSEIGWHPGLAQFGQRKPIIWAVEAGYAFIARFRRHL